MGYDLEVRADANYSKSVPLEELALFVASLPGVTQTGSESFVLSRVPGGIHVNIDLAHECADEDGPAEATSEVSSASLMVPYPLMAKSGPIALEMAFQIAEKLGWVVYDPQGNCDLSRASSARASGIQASSGAAAKSILESAAVAETSLGELFSQEMWNHSLASATVSFVAVAEVSIWLMISWGWTQDRFAKYLPWVVTLGGLGVLWLKAFIQAWLRIRRAGHRTAASTVKGEGGQGVAQQAVGPGHPHRQRHSGLRIGANRHRRGAMGTACVAPCSRLGP